MDNIIINKCQSLNKWDALSKEIQRHKNEADQKCGYCYTYESYFSDGEGTRCPLARVCNMCRNSSGKTSMVLLFKLLNEATGIADKIHAVIKKDIDKDIANE